MGSLRMLDLAAAVDLLTRQTEELSWDSLSKRMSLDLAPAQQHSSKVLIGKLFGLRPPAKPVFLNIIHTSGI